MARDFNLFCFFVFFRERAVRRGGERTRKDIVRGRGKKRRRHRESKRSKTGEKTTVKMNIQMTMLD